MTCCTVSACTRPVHARGLCRRDYERWLRRQHGRPDLAGPHAVHTEDLDAEWRGRAACINTPIDWWFPGSGGTTTQARACCSRCPVVAACLESALTVPGHVDQAGIRAGIGPTTRQKLRQDRKRVTRHE